MEGGGGGRKGVTTGWTHLTLGVTKLVSTYFAHELIKEQHAVSLSILSLNSYRFTNNLVLKKDSMEQDKQYEPIITNPWAMVVVNRHRHCNPSTERKKNNENN